MEKELSQVLGAGAPVYESMNIPRRKQFKMTFSERKESCGYIAYHEPFNTPKFNPNLIIDTDTL